MATIIKLPWLLLKEFVDRKMAQIEPGFTERGYMITRYEKSGIKAQRFSDYEKSLRG